jgi:hypothetical protein
MMFYLRAGTGLFGSAAAVLYRLLTFGPPVGVRASPAWKRSPGQAPPCLRRAMEGWKHLEVHPATEERSLSALTKGEAEQVLDWLEGNGFQLREVSYHEQTGFVVCWDVR